MPWPPAPLSWDVFTSEPLPTLVDEPPPGERHRVWPPISSTLIYGVRDAVLVDAPITVDQVRTLMDRIVAAGKNLTAVYVTHGHGDHWFGAGALTDRFPGARIVAIPAVAEQMRQHATDAELALWKARFPGRMPDRIRMPEEIRDHVVELEGQQLTAVELGHTDTDDTTCLHVPSVGLVAAGDAVYNGVYLQLRESDVDTRSEWIAAADTIESLHPSSVIAGHKSEGRSDGTEIIAETRQYIRDFEDVLAKYTTAREVFDRMVSRYPTWKYPGALWASAARLKDS
ncbi:MBL fold metallo-hydrolase [Streptomyces odonnellii]|uniref:MBL fold metallo-hydrolase n=1 Tax=Streptomyces odonnellii TaxID=1417980 RepID=UPI0018E3B7FC|nr:MBL fold metallo-hydrolase [Streptomyces odonnellii]